MKPGFCLSFVVGRPGLFFSCRSLFLFCLFFVCSLAALGLGCVGAWDGTSSGTIGGGVTSPVFCSEAKTNPTTPTTVSTERVTVFSTAVSRAPTALSTNGFTTASICSIVTGAAVTTAAFVSCAINDICHEFEATLLLSLMPFRYLTGIAP